MSSLFRICPHCQCDVEPDDSVCPHCRQEIGSIADPSSRKAAWIILALLIVMAGVGLAVREMIRPRGREATGPDGQKYIQAPERVIGEPEDFRPLIRVSELASSPAERIKIVLSDELGPGARISSERIAGYDQWVAIIFTPSLANSNTRIEVMPYKNKVLFIKFRFESRYPNRAELLSLLGLEPCTTLPAIDAMEGPKWTYLAGLDEVAGTYDPKGGPGIREVTVTPNKALHNFFLRGGQ